MKKSFLLVILIMSIQMSAQEAKTWRFGLQVGLHGNHSQFSGGMEEANAKFYSLPFRAASVQVIARYDLNNRLMLTTGAGYNSYGFEYSLAQNYSLLREQDHYSTIRSSFSSIEIPTLMHYKFNPSCTNTKWVIGAGFAHILAGDQQVYSESKPTAEGVPAETSIRVTAQNTNELSCMFRMIVSREKVYANKSIFQASIVLSVSSKELAASQVEYLADGKNYQHSFSNNGNYFGFKLAYFLKPFSNQK